MSKEIQSTMIHWIKRFGRKIVSALTNLLGLEFFLKKPGYVYMYKKPNHHYVPDYFGGGAAAKHMDIRTLTIFGSLAKNVIQNRRTLLYYDRLYIIFQIIKNIENTPTSSSKVNFAEVGVYKGGGSFFIASAADALGIKNATLHCFDTFEGHSAKDVRSEIDPFHKPTDFGDVEFLEVQQYLKKFDNLILHKGRFQDTCLLVQRQKFHFVHLDVDIYEPTHFALSFFDQNLITQGIIIVDDYGFNTCPGVKKAVDEFIGTRPNYFLLQLLTGQCILIKKY